jgi:cytochrome P450
MYVALFYELTKFNLQFINETVRLANIVPGIFRKVLRDIQFKGMSSQNTSHIS